MAPPDAMAVLRRFIVLKNLFVKALAVPPRGELARLMTQWTPDERAEFEAQLRQAFGNQAEKLGELGVWDEMNEAEREFMCALPLEIGVQKIIDNMWLSESAVCLLWSLGYVEELPPYDQQSNPQLTNRLPRESMKELESKIALRPVADIQRQREIAELWHWRSRTRSLGNGEGASFRAPNGKTIEKIVQLSAQKAAEDGYIPPPIDGDFAAFGKAYRNISDQEYFLATSIAIERHRAFNWLCGYAPGNAWAQTPTDT
ncbi:MAG TPA: DUF4272 domain-containing protein [Candidatus Aquilonibacter sp.]|nr:DUF4272 domain-containing protein [Candidatus Aquilonibacter sp.]